MLVLNLVQYVLMPFWQSNHCDGIDGATGALFSMSRDRGINKV